ncbi:hypothetical protein T1E_0507 [Pseudomonas putida DOT-T1E]|uniref:Uncharacterized protein n=1 Tax=Pseudomonas putida (strain DOT-T1E) TaxID=1196325 RepID=I7AUP8_PSEPT|nr:hypothetical protein T1E_0507 [Pseudomonas putida DOT-T1E]
MPFRRHVHHPPAQKRALSANTLDATSAAPTVTMAHSLQPTRPSPR